MIRYSLEGTWEKGVKQDQQEAGNGLYRRLVPGGMGY